MTAPACIAALRRALEIAHFARRLRGTRFVVALGTAVPLARLLLDVRLVAAYDLLGVIVTRRSAVDEGSLDALIAEGVPLATCPADPAAVRAALETGRLPVVLVDAPASPSLGLVERVAASLAAALGARRLLCIRAHAALDAVPRSAHLTTAEADSQIGAAAGIARTEWQFAVDCLRTAIAGVVFLPATPGCLFEELFTHHGAGVLIGDPSAERIRPATAADAADIGLLLKAEMQRGVVRAADDREIARTAHQHLVYTMDDLIVGTARLAPHGEWAEMSRFATLPRYRGRGRARMLGEALIDQARVLGYQHLFALSIDARMWSFFESLGFEGIERSALPLSWQAGYDLSRPSRAFHREVGSADAH